MYIHEHCKNLCKCHNVSPPSTTIKEKIRLLFLGSKVKFKFITLKVMHIGAYTHAVIFIIVQW
jgi:hypothetical protein